MDTLAERLKFYRERAGLKPMDLSYNSKVAIATIYQIEAGTNIYPNRKTLDKLAATLNIPSSKLIDNPEKNETVDDAFSKVDRKKVRVVPIINKAQCGRWTDFTDLDYPAGVAEEYMPAVTRDRNAFFIIAEGDSMIDDGIQTGDLLLVEPNKQVTNGAIVFARDPNNGVTVKRMYRDKDGSIRLQPSNSKYPPIIVRDDKDFRVYKVAGKFSKF